MFKPKKVIPTLAASVLAIAGCASGDGDPGGTAGTGGSAGSGGTAGMGGGPTEGLTNALNAFCLKYVECFPNEYNNADECAATISQAYGLDGTVSAECNSAAISYFDCGAALSCVELDMESTSCDPQGTAAEEACTEI